MENKKVISLPTLLNKFHDTKSFDCGVTALNKFLQNYALQNVKNRSVKTFVTVAKERENSQKVIV